MSQIHHTQQQNGGSQSFRGKKKTRFCKVDLTLECCLQSYLSKKSTLLSNTGMLSAAEQHSVTVCVTQKEDRKGD